MSWGWGCIRFGSVCSFSGGYYCRTACNKRKWILRFLNGELNSYIFLFFIHWKNTYFSVGCSLCAWILARWWSGKIWNASCLLWRNILLPLLKVRPADLVGSLRGGYDDKFEDKKTVTRKTYILISRTSIDQILFKETFECLQLIQLWIYVIFQFCGSFAESKFLYRKTLLIVPFYYRISQMQST